ncbi:hypothetical protein HY469_00945 [Candidatus Roizmanbacteria bacterium]|nr:hypothetical protein [Candidatus Roizmanbacteria bacterium]
MQEIMSVPTTRMAIRKLKPAMQQRLLRPLTRAMTTSLAHRKQIIPAQEVLQ